MLKALIIDDEKECLDSLALDLENYCPQIQLLEKCQGGKEGIKAIHKHQPDIIFLDIDMPFISGFDVLEMVAEIDFEIIFTTAYDKYALQAFKISAVDYLLKPIDPEELQLAIKKAQKLRERKGTQKQIQFLMEQIKDLESNNVRKIALPTFDGLSFIRLEDIVYCQSDGSYSYVHYVDGTQSYLSKTLRWLEEALCDYHFYRVHNSFIINIQLIEKYSKSEGGQIIMSTGAKIKVSRSKKEELLQLF